MEDVDVSDVKKNNQSIIDWPHQSYKFLLILYFLYINWL